jgi:hypothetical protein
VLDSTERILETTTLLSSSHDKEHCRVPPPKDPTGHTRHREEFRSGHPVILGLSRSIVMVVEKDPMEKAEKHMLSIQR